jgi:transposase
MTTDEKIYSLEKLISGLLSRVTQLESENDHLRQENIVLRQENTDLRSRLNKNSNNSHKPPSSDGYSKKPALPKPVGKALGGQSGHQGKTLEMVSNPDKVVEHYAQFCRSCQDILTSDNVIKLGSKHQVFDLPEQKLWVTEHQLNISRCRCGCQTKAVLPSNLAVCPVQYGSSIKSLSVYLNTEFKLPFNKINTLFSDLYGYQFNESTAWSANQLAFERLENIETQIKQRLLEANVLHADETGIRCAGSLHWLHVTSNPLYTYLFVHQKRGKIAIESQESILPKFSNYLMHDCWASYWNLPQSKHLICNAHILRELQALIDKGKQWAKLMQTFLLELYAKTKKVDKVLDIKFIPSIVSEFHQICQQGIQQEPKPLKTHGKKGRVAKSKGLNLLERLKNNQDGILSFAFFQELPFTNNQAERDLRMVKTKIKVSTCFRTVVGAKHYARIQGFISTIRKQQMNPFQNLKLVFDNQFQWT